MSKIKVAPADAPPAQKIDGYTLQFSGPPILRDEGLVDDRGWFERHHGRNHRIRRPIGGEVDCLDGGPPHLKPVVVVRQVAPGARIRVACRPRHTPLNSEAAAAAVFEAAADDQMVARVAALVAEARL